MDQIRGRAIVTDVDDVTGVVDVTEVSDVIGVVDVTEVSDVARVVNAAKVAGMTWVVDSTAVGDVATVGNVAACTVLAAHTRDHDHGLTVEHCHPHSVQVVYLGHRALTICHDCCTDSGFLPSREAESLAEGHRGETLGTSVPLIGAVAS